MLVDRDFESAAIEIRNGINQIVEIDPRRHQWWSKTFITRRNAEKKHLLSRHVNQFAKQIGKQFRQPWTTCIHQRIRAYSSIRCDSRLQIVDTNLLRLRHDRLDSAARQQHTRIRFENPPRRFTRIKLRESVADLVMVQLFHPRSDAWQYRQYGFAICVSLSRQPQNARRLKQ